MSEIIVPAGVVERLDRVLALLIPGLSRGAARRLIDAGAVYVDGRRCRVASRQVGAGSRLRVETGPLPSRGEAAVLYEDEHLIAVDKPAGTPSLPTRAASSGTAFESLRRSLRRSDSRPPALYSVHRLDAAVSGVLLFAKTRPAAAALAEAFRGRAVDKLYIAVVRGVPHERDGRIETPILARGRRAMIDADGKDAITEWRTRAARSERCVLEARPLTGRMHQIRIHLASIGHPIAGDRLYGGPPAARLMLHAWRLELSHPASGDRIRIEAPLPEVFL